MFGTIVPDAATGVNISSLFYVLSLISLGHHVPRNSSRIFRQRNRLHGRCRSRCPLRRKRASQLDPPPVQTCASYLVPYIDSVGGTLINPQATQQCQFCPFANTDAVL